MVRYFWVGQCDGEQSESGDGYKENKVIENTMGEPGDGEQSGQGGEEYSCKDNTEFANIMFALHIIIPLFHF